VSQPASDGVVCCTIGAEQFAVRAADVRLVARVEHMRVAGGPHGQVGVLDQGAVPVPVYNLAVLLDRRAAETRGAQHVVLLSAGARSIGVIVDRAVRMPGESDAHVMPLPRFVGRRCHGWFGGLLQAGDWLCLLLSPRGIDPETDHTPAHHAAPGPGTRRRTEPAAADLVVTFQSAALPRCATARYALCARQVAGVVQALQVMPLPGAPSFVAGLSSWQGAAVPLVDFTGAQRHSRFLLVRTQDGCAAIPVEADVALRHASSEHRQVGGRSAPFITGLFETGDERIALLDVDALVSSDERELTASCAG
jgi:chemotaxis signal transduction protein